MEFGLSLSSALRDELALRQSRNPKYSIRALARDFDLSVSTLAEVIRGSRVPSRSFVRRIVNNLQAGGKALSEQLQGCANADAELANEAKSRRMRFITLEDRKFRVIADWQHFAILSLMETKDFQSNPDWIARRLGISVRKARASLKNLTEVGCIKRNSNGTLQRTAKSFTSSDGIPSEAIRQAHGQVLELARTSLERDDVKVRDFVSMCVAIDPARMDEAREVTRNYLERVSRLLKSGEQSEVYRVSVNIFPVAEPMHDAGPAPSQAAQEGA